jgi:glutamine synthetase
MLEKIKHVDLKRLPTRLFIGGDWLEAVAGGRIAVLNPYDQSELATTCANLKAVGYTFDTDTLDKITDLVKQLQDGLSALEHKMHGRHGVKGGLVGEAKYFHDVVRPAMQEVRKAADTLEGYVADDLWPLPTYQEMLFIK